MLQLPTNGPQSLLDRLSGLLQRVEYIKKNSKKQELINAPLPKTNPRRREKKAETTSQRPSNIHQNEKLDEENFPPLQQRKRSPTNNVNSKGKYKY